MKKILSFICIISLLATTAVLFSGCGNTVTLNVYNWGEYMSLGADDTLNVNKAFSEYCQEKLGMKVKVNYLTFASNEDMYAKLSSGAVSYDVIIPSDYMIARLVDEGLLAELNFDNIPNYEYIEEDFRNLYYDPDNKYSVPYTYGRIGIIYNANKVDAADAKGWELMWNEKYSGQIVQYNNSRDAFGTAMYKLGINPNTTNPEDWDRALTELQAQKPLVKAYVMDEIYNTMESGDAWIGSYYAGDYFTMLDNQADNVDLKFYYPERTNLFVDAMCVPKTSQNKELAEEYINFLLSEEPAIANAEYIYYSSPNSLVYNNEQYKKDMGETAMEILYPKSFDFAEQYNTYCYRDLDTATKELLNKHWETLKR